MIFFCRPEGSGRSYFGDNGGREGFLPFQFGNFGFGLLFLFRSQVKNGGAVLSADVRPLAILGCRIVDFEKNVQQFGVADFVSIKADFDRFGMSGLSG